MSGSDKKKKVLFVCKHNAARSQIAEGLLRELYGQYYDVFSAGTEPIGLNPYAIKVMAEIGIDISTGYSKNLDEFKGMEFDYVVTLCDYAKESCSLITKGNEIIHKDFSLPDYFDMNEIERIAVFREVRNEIMNWIKETFSNE